MMKILKFKTNINCGSCVRAVTPHLNKLEGVSGWEVDTENPDKILKVESETMDAPAIRNAIEKAGFKAEQV